MIMLEEEYGSIIQKVDELNGDLSWSSDLETEPDLAGDTSRCGDLS